MRELVLNHASIRTPDDHWHQVIDWLRGISAGMAQLTRAEVVQTGLRMRYSVSEITCTARCSLYDAYQELRRSGHRDEYRFLMGLSARLPLLNGVEDRIADRFRECEGRTLPPPDGEPLVLCAIADWIAVGFPSDSLWDRDRITVLFDELLPDESIDEAAEEIDQLTREVHARTIQERLRERQLDIHDQRELWSARAKLFPHLLFGRDVEYQLEQASAQFSTVIAKLRDLDRSAQEWRTAGGPAPPWKTKVTPESRSTRNHPKLMRERYFRSHFGTMKLFEWHARYGDGGRIHLRFDAAAREVEIGYIGPKLRVR